MPLQWVKTLTLTVLLPAIQGIFRIRGYRAAISTSAKRYIGKSVSWAWKHDIKPKKKQKEKCTWPPLLSLYRRN
ncbi:hypothetical protein T09_5097 [Trichinella sp. T9]|nr:hypothetical protein T09_5097 [Trichinella sp. T9]